MRAPARGIELETLDSRVQCLTQYTMRETCWKLSKTISDEKIKNFKELGEDLQSS